MTTKYSAQEDFARHAGLSRFAACSRILTLFNSCVI